MAFINSDATKIVLSSSEIVGPLQWLGKFLKLVVHVAWVIGIHNSWHR